MRVRATQPETLHELLASRASVTRDGDALAVTGLTSEAIATLARDRGVLLTELTPVHASLEEAYLRLTQHDVEYRATLPTPSSTADPRSAAA